MEGPGFPTLDQLRVFLAVVETGSFAAAAPDEGHLGGELFDRQSRTAAWGCPL